MGAVYVLGNLLLSIVGSVLGSKFESLIAKRRESRKKEKSPSQPK